MTIAAGTYKGRGVTGSEQYGTTSKGNDQIVLDIDLVELGTRVSTFLVFSDNSAAFSIDRLRALGWEGNDLLNLVGIDRNEVDVLVKYELYQGEQKMKVEIMTGGGRVTLQDQMNDTGKRAFAARFNKLAAVAGGQAPGARPTGQGSDPTSFPYGQNAPPQRAGGVKL